MPSPTAALREAPAAEAALLGRASSVEEVAPVLLPLPPTLGAEVAGVQSEAVPLPGAAEFLSWPLAVARKPRVNVMRLPGRKSHPRRMLMIGPSERRVSLGTPTVSTWHANCHSVDAFSERQIFKKNRRRCSLHRGGRSARGAGRSAAWCEARWYSLRRGGLSAARGRTVRGLVRG
jgi:hypothetical protein